MFTVHCVGWVIDSLRVCSIVRVRVQGKVPDLLTVRLKQVVWREHVTAFIVFLLVFHHTSVSCNTDFKNM